MPRARPRPRPAAAFGAALLLVLAACAPATEVATPDATLRSFRLAPLPAEGRYLVAVYDIETDPTRVDVSVLPARERDERLFTDLGSGIGDVVTRELFELDRFDLVERRNLAAVLAEQDLGQSGRFDPATAATVGRLLGADLILVGAVTELSIDRASASTLVPGFLGGATITTVAVEVELRFVDVATGRILGLGTGRGTGRDAEVSVDAVQQALRLLRVGTVRQSIVATALRNAIREAVENAADRLPPKAD